MDQPVITKADTELQEQRAARWTLVGCSILVFITSVCIMVLELVASRLIAKAVGSSLYTWTSVIGVILAGITIGNFFGGWIADRYDHRRSLGWLFFIASFCCVTIYPLSQLMSTRGRPEWISWPVWVVINVSSLFLHPSVVLGMISPITASMALAKARKTGSTVGNVYAWGAMGSIIGTFLAGFYLISTFGTQSIIWMTAAVLALLGVAVSSGQHLFRGAMLFGWLQFVLAVGLLASCKAADLSAEEHKKLDRRSEAVQKWTGVKVDFVKWGKWFNKVKGKAHALGLELHLRADDAGEYNDESDYFYINVANRHERGDTVKALHLDHLTHSYFNPDKPTELYYDYEEVYAAVTERAVESWNRSMAISLPSLPAGGKQLPGWAKYDPNTKLLTVQGAMSADKRAELLALSPSAAYWKAIEELSKPENMTLASGLSTLPLEKLPGGMTIPEKLERKIRHDETLGTLIRYDTLTEGDREQLLALAPDEAFREAVEQVFARSRRVSTLFIGGGGFVFPRWIEAYFPHEPRIHVLELDPAVKRAVQSEMGLPPDDKTFVRAIIGDARNSVDDLLNGYAREPGSQAPHNYYDFVYGDAFNDFSVPWHLTTQEFDEKIKSLMTPGEGVFLVNIIDIYPRATTPEQDPQGFAEVSNVTGPLPAEVWPGQQANDKWYAVSKPTEYGKVEALKEASGRYKLRCHEALSDEQLAAWHELLEEKIDPEVATPMGEVPAGKKKSGAKPAGNANGKSVEQAIDVLGTESNRFPVYTGELPAAIIPDEIAGTEDDHWDAWVLAKPPYDYLELKLRKNPPGAQLPTAKSRSYVLGMRGVASREKEEELLKLADGNKDLQRRFQELVRQSRAGKPGRFLGAYVNTVCQVFPNVYVFSANEGLPNASRDTFVVACSLKPLDFKDLKRSGNFWSTPPFAAMETPASGQPVYTTQLKSILELARGMTLTDDYAPVDNLLIPVFTDQ